MTDPAKDMTKDPGTLAGRLALAAYWDKVLKADGLDVIDVSGDNEFIPGLETRRQQSRLIRRSRDGSAFWYTQMERWTDVHPWSCRRLRALWVASSRGEPLASVFFDWAYFSTSRQTRTRYRKWHERMVRTRNAMRAAFETIDYTTHQEEDES